VYDDDLQSWNGPAGQLLYSLQFYETDRTLDRELTDTSGLPAPKLHHRLSGNSQRNLTFALERMREAHEAAGARYVVDEPNIASGHLLGTARMGTDARTSVVDQFCRSHDIPNLLIVDGSVMVTSGAMNPTATITALALRASEHLANTFQHQRCLV
jgi:choline dehydrogenase-like flavoprotein